MNRSSSSFARLSSLLAKGKTIDDTADFLLDSHGGTSAGVRPTVDRNPVTAFFTIFLSAWTRPAGHKDGKPVGHAGDRYGSRVEIDNSGQGVQCYRLCQSDF